MKGISRFIAFIFILSNLLLPLGALAAAQDMSISVQWMDGAGNVQYSDPAVPLTGAPDETRFWITLPWDAPLTGLTLSIADLSGQYVSFLPSQGDELTGVMDAMGTLNYPPVQIQAMNAYGEAGAVYSLYLSYQPMPQAEATEAPAYAAPEVTIHSVDEAGLPLMEDQILTLQPGVSTVYAASVEGYSLIGADSCQITVDDYGASPSEVTFVYARAAVSANVTVRYVDEAGLPLLDDMIYTYGAGEYLIRAAQIDQYAPLNQEYLVKVDENGAQPSEVTFVYAPYIAPAAVTVHYVDDTGMPLLADQTLTLEAGEQTVYAQPIAGYELLGQEAQRVIISSQGAEPSEITFTYTRPVLPVDIWVHYVDEFGAQLAPDTMQTLQPGANVVYPGAQLSPDQYLLTGPSFVEVNVTADGPSQAEVTFTYQQVAQSAVITLHYVHEQGAPIAADTYITVEPGIHQIAPDAIIPQDEYTLLPPETVPVIVDINGANLTEITFQYRKLSQPVRVLLHYTDEFGMTIAPDTELTCDTGEYTFTPQADISPEDYTLLDPAAYTLTVDASSAPVNEFTFTYRGAAVPKVVIVRFVDENGNPVADEAEQTLEMGSFVIFAQPQNLLPDYVLAEGEANFQNVTVDEEGAHPNTVTFRYEYRPAGPAVVPIYYLDTDSGLSVASDGAAEVPAGSSVLIGAQPADLLPGYVLVGQDAVEVTVSADGQSSTDAVIFYYQYQAPVDEPVLTPTDEPANDPQDSAPSLSLVTVRYQDASGNPVASDTQVLCAYGDTLIQPAPQDLLPGYALAGDESLLVHVDAQGAYPEPVFIYQPLTEAPAPKVALVNVKYLNPDGEAFYAYPVTCAEGQENPVAVDWSQVDEALGYHLVSPEIVYVTVDHDGAATPAEVVFQFRGETTAAVSIRFLDAQTGREIASAQTADCFVGANVVDARPLDLEENYMLYGEDSMTVFLSEEGRLSPEEVIFLYFYQATPSPAPAVPAFETPLDAYFYPSGTAVRVRSTPTTAEDNIVATVSSGDLGHALGKVTTASNKVWYAVEINGVMGYMSESVVRFLSEAEQNAIFGYTQTPTQSPTPSPTDVPDGAAIDRWAVTTAAVNFRRGADRNADRLTELKKNSSVWIYSQKTVGGEKWYFAQYNGQDGYVMADFVELLSEEESAALQAQLFTPVATQGGEKEVTPETTLEPTDAPAEEPTEAPTEIATEEQTEEPTEAPTDVPTEDPTETPTEIPTEEQTEEPTEAPTDVPTENPTEAPTDVPTEEPTEAPTEIPTAVPTPPPTETPAPYRGYALTNGQAALRTGVSQTDDTILEMLPDQSLLIVNGQTYVDGVAWASAQSVSSGNLGFILQSSLTPITSEEARPYLERIQNTPAATATPVPEQTSGYAMTLGDGVPMRNFPDTNGQILMLLPYMAVADVRGQQYSGGDAWHLVQYNGLWGYIRQDQLRMMTPEEAQAYEQTLTAGTPTPSPAPTPEPVTEESLSSYGHIQSNSGRVNLRSEPTTQRNNAIRLLDNYAFALVLGSVTNDEGLWYHISQGGSEGYVRGDYFHVLSLGELSEFLQSSEYLNANSNNASNVATSSQIQPVEDYNRTVWQNPALTASYEPFNPFTTPTPDPERLPTASPAPTATPSPTPEIAPVPPEDSEAPEANTRDSGSILPWVMVGLAVVFGAAAYIYYVHTQNELRRREMRELQARQARTQAAQRPQMRSAMNNPAQGVARPSYPQDTAAFMPPQAGSPRPAAPDLTQATGVYRAGKAAPAETQPFQPVRQETQAYQPLRQETQAYQPPVNSGADDPFFLGNNAAPAQETKPFQPVSAPAGQDILSSADSAAQSAPRKRIRRTERNKALYEQDNKNDF